MTSLPSDLPRAQVCEAVLPPALVCWWFHTVFPGPYQAFSIDVLPNFPWSYRCENYIKFFFEVLLNVIFKVIDISMETIY